MSWKSYKLGELLERKRVKAEIEPDQVYKLVTIRLWHQGVVLREEKSGQDIKSNMFHVNEGDFVLSGIDARNGAFGIVPKELEGAVVTNDFWCLEPKKSLLRKDFFLFLTSTKFFDYICNQCSDGTTQRIRLQKDKFYDFEIVLPPVEEQGDLVKSLANSKQSNEHLSTELTHQLDLVKQLRQAFLREAMQGKLVPQDPNDEPASVLLEKIKAEKALRQAQGTLKKQKPLPPITEEEIPFEIPENWVWCRLGDVTINHDGARVPLSKYERSLMKGEFDYYGAMGVIDYINDYKFEGTFLLIAEDGQNLLRKNKPVAFIANGKFWVNNHAHVSDCYHDITRLIVANYINTIDLEPHISGKPPSQIKLKRSALDLIAFPLPPLSEQQRIVAKLDALMQYCDELDASIKECQHQNELLLQQVLREALEHEPAILS